MKILLKKLFKNKKLYPNTIKSILNNNLDIKQQVEIEFNKVSHLYSSIFKYIIAQIKDITLARCFVCGKILSYDLTVKNTKNKFCSNKCRLSKLGNPFAKPEIKDKIRKNNIIKYGVDNPAKSQYIKEKIKNTVQEKYGVNNVFQNTLIKNKIRNTVKLTYGGNSFYSNKQLAEKAIAAKLKTTYNKLKIKYAGKIKPNFLVNDYIGSNEIYSWQCEKCGNIFTARYDDGIIHGRCLKCYPYLSGYSNMEKELVDFIRLIYSGEIIENSRSIIKPYELDIVIVIDFNEK